jgi:hypothetical protein
MVCLTWGRNRQPRVSTDDILQLQTRVLASNDRGRSTPRRSTSPVHNLILPSPASTARSQINRSSASPCQGISANFVPKRPATALSSRSPSLQARHEAGHATSFSCGAANLRDQHLAYTTSPRYLNAYHEPSPKLPPAMLHFDQQRFANNSGESEGRYASPANLPTEIWSMNTSGDSTFAAQGTREEASLTQPSYSHTGSSSGGRSPPHGFCSQCACQRRDPAGGGSPRYVTIRVPVDHLLAID